MTLEEFLDRVVAPGNYVAIAYKHQDWPAIAHRFHPRDKIKDTASSLRWVSQRGMDSWFALASYKDAEPHSTRRKLIGRRTQENAQALKTFWADADIKRDGDGKDPAKVFRDELEVVQWALELTRDTGIPFPNIWIKSGYGLHLYWSFEDALDKTTWQFYAEALKGALLAHDFKGDLNVVADAARILRPPETFNYKVPDQPAPCFEFFPEKLTKPDFDNPVLLDTLLQQPPNVVALRPSSPPTGSLAAAKAGLQARPRDFGLIAAGCPQVARSLQEQGNGDSRDVWWHLIGLAQFCENGRDWAHEVSKGDPRYTAVETDLEFDRAIETHEQKQMGPPLCKTFNASRPGVCEHCPHWGSSNVTTPFHLGVAAPTEDPDELPTGYRRHGGWIEHAEADGNQVRWRRILEGDLTAPILDEADRHYRISFNYVEPGSKRSRPISLENTKLDIKTAKLVLSEAGVHVSDNAPHVCRLLMAWIDKLQREMRVRGKPLPSFGWHKVDGKYLGF
jgi:hypothetical protein